MAYRSLIEQAEGVTGVTTASWFGGLSQEPLADGEKREEFFAQFATDIERYLALYPEIKVPPDQLRNLLSDRMGCLLGVKIAERLNKKVGDRLVLRSTIWTQKNGSTIWEFNVRALYTTDSPTFDQTMMLIHEKRSTRRGSSARARWGCTARDHRPERSRKSPRPSTPSRHSPSRRGR